MMRMAGGMNIGETMMMTTTLTMNEAAYPIEVLT